MIYSYTRFRNSILGFIIGDALGVPYEFTSKEQMDAYPATDMIGFGVHPVPKGSWSDDSSMMLITMEWLINLKKNNISIYNVGYDELLDLKKRWKKWFIDGYMTPNGECFDIGRQTRLTLSEPQLYNKVSLDPDGQGNGALMRILPFAWLSSVHNGYIDAVEYVMYKTCEITHGNSTSNYFVKRYADDLYNAATDSSLKVRLEMLNGTFDPKSVKSSGWVKDTYECVQLGWLASKSSKDPIESYKKAVLFAVNLGEDTDTVAAITGGLVGASFDKNCLPFDWISNIIKLDVIEDIITEFYELLIKPGIVE
ncbi:MAG: ADP-ribosylglycohydrolase family protein [Candidatus Omnitrophica bacterium]|jgi:ADP-ribosylglycohydrolase|nr:ADP-ribosylglycohydrolase family protein [Candidatus Omnitrophota bacterium]